MQDKVSCIILFLLPQLLFRITKQNQPYVQCNMQFGPKSMQKDILDKRTSYSKSQLLLLPVPNEASGQAMSHLQTGKRSAFKPQPVISKDMFIT